MIAELSVHVVQVFAFTHDGRHTANISMQGLGRHLQEPSKRDRLCWPVVMSSIQKSVIQTTQPLNWDIV